MMELLRRSVEARGEQGGDGGKAAGEAPKRRARKSA